MKIILSKKKRKGDCLSTKVTNLNSSSKPPGEQLFNSELDNETTFYD